MRVDASHLWMIVAGAVVMIAVGVALLRIAKLRILGWLALAAGLGVLALQMLMQFSGRLGPEHLWFRTPSFFAGAAIMLAVAIWWLRRPAPVALRYGLPGVLLAGAAVLAVLARTDGRSVPIAMLLPTLQAPAPELSFLDDAGRHRTLAELRGNVVLLNFWATWCAPCRHEMPMLSRLQREHGDQGLVVLYVSLEQPEVLAPFLAANRFDGIHARLQHAAPYYEAGKFYPLTYLISRDGRVAHRWSGRPQESWLEAQVAAQL